MGIFELPNMMNPDGTMGNIIVAFIGIAISMAVGFLLTMLFYKDEAPAEVKQTAETTNTEVTAANTEVTAANTKKEEILLASPLKGKVMKLSEVKDEAFSSGVLGLGAAIEPEEGVLYAPADGTISALFPTGHAIGLTTTTGLELLMHVGMDTVQLGGKGFKAFVEPGEEVKQGQKLLEFDRKFINDAGYSLVTPVLVANFGEFERVEPTEAKNVQAGDLLLRIR